MIVKLLSEYHLEFLSLKGGCRGSSESTLVKISNCWKSHAAAHIVSLETECWIVFRFVDGPILARGSKFAGIFVICAYIKTQNVT